MDDMLAFNLRWIDKWTVLDYDGLHFADDWGEQNRLMIRPAKWRRSSSRATPRCSGGCTTRGWTSGSTATATSTTSSAT